MEIHAVLIIPPSSAPTSCPGVCPACASRETITSSCNTFMSLPPHASFKTSLPTPALTNAVGPLVFQSFSPATHLLGSTCNASACGVASALTLHACCTPVTSRPLESSTYSNISPHSPPRFRTCFMLQPSACNCARHHNKSSHNSPSSPHSSRITHTRNIDRMSQLSPAPRRSVAAQCRASHDRRQELRST